MIKAHAKLILSGEHAVLRTGPALVMPLRHFSTEILPTGLTSSIPQASGLGSSAALCVCLAKHLGAHGVITDVFQSARLLEDAFHGKSSGVDVAGVMSDGLIRYRMHERPVALDVSWRPHLYVSHSGQEFDTRSAIERVENNPETPSIDSLMNRATELCEWALLNQDLDRLADAMNWGQSCFDRWGLVQNVRDHILSLHLSGAIAVKMTGGGGGGYVMSLWERHPPIEVIENLRLLSVWG